MNQSQLDQKEYQFNYTSVPNLPTFPRNQNYEVYEDPRKSTWSTDNKLKSTQGQPVIKEVNDIQNYKLYDHNPNNVSTTLSVALELSKAIEKLSETNHLMAQNQVMQQRTLQALLNQQEHTYEALEISQRIQHQAIRALMDTTKQQGFDAMFDRITKYDGKDPEKCHFWLNQVGTACLELGRNFTQALMYCTEDHILSVLSGLSVDLSNEEIKEEMMGCFSSTPTRRQAIEMMRMIQQDPDEQIRRYIVHHEVAHIRAHQLSADEQQGFSKIMEFAMTLQPVIQNKLLKKIDGEQPPRTLREAYEQALDIEKKNQITKWY